MYECKNNQNKTNWQNIAQLIMMENVGSIERGPSWTGQRTSDQIIIRVSLCSCG